MLLSSAAPYGPFSVAREGSFRNLGFVHQGAEQMLSFAENARFLRAALRNGSISALLTTAELAAAAPAGIAVGICERPRAVFAMLHNRLASSGFYWEDFATVINPTARVHPTASVAEKNVRIGPGTVVGPMATILERTAIGSEVEIGAASVLGGVGFQTVRGPAMIELTHAGGLTVGDRSRVLPGAIIATGVFRENTIIAPDVRVGSRAFVSHGVRIDERAFVGHGAVVNGGVAVGKDAWIGPGAVISQELEIGEEAVVSLGAVVIRSVPARSRVSGNFAAPHRALLRFMAGLQADTGPS